MFKRIEDLEVWKRGCRLAVEIFRISQSEPIARNWGLRDQIQRASLSIPSNIAEGYERDSLAEFRRFILIAKGSCGELRTQLLIIKAMDIIKDEDLNPVIRECKEISSMLKALSMQLYSGINKKNS